MHGGCAVGVWVEVVEAMLVLTDRSRCERIAAAVLNAHRATNAGAETAEHVTCSRRAVTVTAILGSTGWFSAGTTVTWVHGSGSFHGRRTVSRLECAEGVPLGQET